MADIRDEIKRAAEMTDAELDDLVAKSITVIRAVALEEAAKVCDPKGDCSEQDAYGAAFAAAIRAMISKENINAEA